MSLYIKGLQNCRRSNWSKFSRLHFLPLYVGNGSSLGLLCSIQITRFDISYSVAVTYRYWFLVRKFGFLGFISLNLKVLSLVHACLDRLAESFPVLRHLENFVGLSLFEEIHSELLIKFCVNFLKHNKDIEVLVCFCLHVNMSIPESNIELGQELWLVNLCDVKMRFNSCFKHFFSIRIIVEDSLINCLHFSFNRIHLGWYVIKLVNLWSIFSL